MNRTLFHRLAGWIKAPHALVFLLAAGFSIWKFEISAVQNEMGTLNLSVVDGGSGQIVPARVELLDSKEKAHIAEDALPIGGD